MRLLIVYETIYPDFIGGVEHRNYEVAAALCRRGHEVTLAGFCGAVAPSVENLRILSLGELGSLYNTAGKRSTRQALRFAAVVGRLDLGPFDLVETPNMPYLHLLPLAWKCAAAGKPLLVTWYEHWGAYWRGYVGRLRAPAYRAVEWITAQLGAEVTATSDLTAARLAAARWRRPPPPLKVDRRKEGGGVPFPPGGVGRGLRGCGGRSDRRLWERGGSVFPHIEVIPCGITVSRVRAAAAAGRPGDGPALIFAGRLLAHKRLDVALRAVQILARDAAAGGDGGGARPLLTVFGEGPARARLEAMAAELGIAGRVEFRGHVKSSDEVWRDLGRARIAVQPSAREGFGLFPLEAMAAGLPVVYCSSPESAVGELVRDGVEGLAVPADPGALAAALAKLLAPAGEAERRRLAGNALARAACYDWDEIARRIEEICLGLIARRRR